ncbi:MAG: tRNA lysidine(34) synthetase TilS [Candidatus Eremiobacteraeota bacterium]|nr:tRNA lysidine(34) synthetase TilS [Candidatus Eremiobacteraeota bacterium]
MRGAKPEAAIEQSIERDGVMQKGDRIVVACSGGADSVALAAVLHGVRAPMELELTLAYVNHGTRESAWQDECVVLRIGATFGLPVRVVHLKGEARDEASLRTARYSALAAIARDANANVIATAHHQEDQSETVMLALLRGTGPEGIAGMRPRRELEPGVELARPLLRVAADDLRHYCHVHALPYAVDPTNADLGIRRNAVRQALDALRPLFPGLDAAVARTAELVGEEVEQTDRAALRRRVRNALDAEEALRDVDFEHVEAVVRALERGRSGRFHMKAGIELEIAAGDIEVRKQL